MVAFKTYQDAFKLLLGDNPRLEKVLEEDWPFAFEAGIYLAEKNEVFVTSLPIVESDTRRHEISRIYVQDGVFHSEKIPSADIPMANGGVNYKDGMIFCAQGSMNAASGIYFVQGVPPYRSEPVVTSFYDRPFNSVNDVVVHTDGSIWFTDPAYGFGEGYRPPPRLPNQVYRYNPANGSIRVMADRIEHPNGICFSPDEDTVYITDSDQIWGDGSVNEARAATIYAYDTISIHGEPFLVNRRVFAMVDNGFPDGVKCDTDGNVYSGCGDGLHVWSPGGVLIGKIDLEGMVANFCFGQRGEIFMLTGNAVWRAKLNDNVRGALLKI